MGGFLFELPHWSSFHSSSYCTAEEEEPPKVYEDSKASSAYYELLENKTD
jgi:hypothetical protein